MLLRTLCTLLSIIALVATKSYGQCHALDSIKAAVKEEPSFFIGFHNRNTFILTDRTKLYGIVGGLDYNNKVSFYAGIYGFGRENRTELSNPNEFNLDTVYRFTSVSNFSLGMSYVYYTKGRLSLNVPLQIGVGNAEYTFENGNNNTIIDEQNYTFIPVETGTNAYFELLPWAGIRAGVGYRLHLGAKPARRLNSPYYNIGLAVLLKPLIEEIKAN